MQKSRTPLMIGWDAARANAKPALIIQAIMLALAIAFYTNSSVADALRTLAEFKRAHGLFFVIVASVAAGALLPEFFLILFFQRGRPQRANLRTSRLRFQCGDLTDHLSIFSIARKRIGWATSR